MARLIIFHNKNIIIIVIIIFLIFKFKKDITFILPIIVNITIIDPNINFMDQYITDPNLNYELKKDFYCLQNLDTFIYLENNMPDLIKYIETIILDCNLSDEEKCIKISKILEENLKIKKSLKIYIKMITLERCIDFKCNF
jgi:hypothetical protein